MLAKLVGPNDENWDNVVLVEYLNWAAFRGVVESPEYQRDAGPTSTGGTGRLAADCDAEAASGLMLIGVVGPIT